MSGLSSSSSQSFQHDTKPWFPSRGRRQDPGDDPNSLSVLVSDVASFPFAVDNAMKVPYLIRCLPGEVILVCISVKLNGYAGITSLFVYKITFHRSACITLEGA